MSLHLLQLQHHDLEQVKMEVIWGFARAIATFLVPYLAKDTFYTTLTIDILTLH